MSPFTAKQKALFFMCSSPRGRARARSKCPAPSDARRLAEESRRVATLPAKKKRG